MIPLQLKQQHADTDINNILSRQYSNFIFCQRSHIYCRISRTYKFVNRKNEFNS